MGPWLIWSSRLWQIFSSLNTSGQLALDPQTVAGTSFRHRGQLRPRARGCPSHTGILAHAVEGHTCMWIQALQIDVAGLEWVDLHAQRQR